MDDGNTENDPEVTAREEDAAIRGWLRLADDVLKTPKADGSPEEPLEEPAGDAPA
jgi:hypothetical protein